MVNHEHKGKRSNGGVLEAPHDLSGDAGVIALPVAASLPSIRAFLRNLSPDREDELFHDFDTAVKSRNLGYLADTIANWATGGHGYEDAGAHINTRLDALPALADDPELRAAWEEYKAQQSEDTETTQ